MQACLWDSASMRALSPLKKYGACRVQWSDGSLSDMVNLTRVFACANAARVLRRELRRIVRHFPFLAVAFSRTTF